MSFTLRIGVSRYVTGEVTFEFRPRPIHRRSRFSSVGVMDDIAAVRQAAMDLRADIFQRLDAAVADPAQVDATRPKIKSFLEHQRSALDYLAAELVAQFGTPSNEIYYPMPWSEAKFPKTMNLRMPGVAASRPDIAEVIKKHQPWASQNTHPFHDLVVLANPNKHRRLSVQLLREVPVTTVTEKATGYQVRLIGVQVRPGLLMSEPGGGTIGFQPGPSGAPSKHDPPVKVGGLLGTTVFGVPFDRDGRMLRTPGIDVEESTMTEWCFFDPHQPVKVTLDRIAQKVQEAVREISQLVGWS